MARPFVKKDARVLIDKHTTLLKQLRYCIEANTRMRNNVIAATNTLLAREAMILLRDVPVEEINRSKGGIRVGALRTAGFDNFAKLYAATTYQIAAIPGISYDTANFINRITKEHVKEVQKTVKLQLSYDDKNKESTALVKSIFVLKNSVGIVNDCLGLLQEYENKIEHAITDLSSRDINIPWFLLSVSKKQKLIDSYEYLNQLLVSDYFKRSLFNLNTLGRIGSTSSDLMWEDFSRNSIQYYNILEKIVPGVLGSMDSKYGLPEELAREIEDQVYFPDGLLCELRRYQEWGVKYALHQEKVLLGDEMGLGKTIQAIATMVSLKNTGAKHFVVVCPASVMINWVREISAKSKLRVVQVHGATKKQAFKSWLNSGGVAVTSYETTKLFKFDDEFKFSLLVVDEAHYIKNPEAARSKNVADICKHSDRLLFMTGTALENKVDEMISLIKILNPQVSSQVENIAYLSSAPVFREKIAPVYYRRKREDVLTELPEKEEIKQWCTMTPEEERVYEQAVIDKKYAESRRVSWNVDDLQYSSKAKRLRELVEEAESENRKAIVFSYFLDTMEKVRMILGDRCVGAINGSVSPQRRQEIIDEFDNAPAGAVLPAQIQAGGTGLNIQSASVVIICEPQFKPSIENQAIARAYRMGQARKVLVYRLLCENSIDEKLVDLLAEKQRIFNAFADESVAAKNTPQEDVSVDDKSFGKIIQEEIDRINRKNGKT